MIPREDLWSFSLAVYARPGIETACLSLQDRRAVDVNRLLHALWCGALGHRITMAEQQRLQQSVADWHDHAVKPLRETRRWLKNNIRALGREGAAHREAVKRLELEAERLEQKLLERTLKPSARAGGPEHAAANLLSLVPDPTRADQDDLALLLETLWPGVGRETLKQLLTAGVKGP